MYPPETAKCYPSAEIIGKVEQIAGVGRLTSMLKALVFVIPSLALLALACTNDETQPQDATPPATLTATATVMATPGAPESEQPGPPDLEVAVGEATINAGIGTYCWADGGLAVCVDAVGVVTPSLALVGQGQPPLVARLPGLALSEATATAWRIDEGLLCDPDQPGTIACGALRVESGLLVWPFGVLGEGRELPVRVDGDTVRVVSSLESGTYVVSLSLAFEGRGDVNYGVLLVLLPAEG